MNIEQILQTLDVNAPAGIATTGSKKEPTVEELGPFTFSEGLDKVGLPIEHPSYVKRSCKNCRGRGGVIQLVGGRHWQTCGCVNKGYTKLRMAFGKRAAELRLPYPKVVGEESGLDEEAANKQALLELKP